MGWRVWLLLTGMSRSYARLHELTVVADAIARDGDADGFAVGQAEAPVIVTAAQQARVSGYIASGIESGATLAMGGLGIPAGLEGGHYVRPTIFANVDNGMKIAREEIFGPVMSVIAYDGVDDAVRIANDSDYGLSGGVWTADAAAGLAAARRVRTGTFSVNGAGPDFLAPFGGFKQSGIGREFGSAGIGEYVVHKSISV